MYLLVRLLDVPVLSLVSANLPVHSLAPVPTFRKGQPSPSSCKVLLLFHSCFLFDTHSPLHFKNNSMKVFLKDSPFFLNSGSVDAIVFSRTGNHLLQCLWFSNSFFTVDGCIDYVRGILNS